MIGCNCFQGRVKLPLNNVVDTERIILQPIHRDFAGEIFREYTHEIAECMYAQPCSLQETLKRINHARELMELRMQSTFIVRDIHQGHFLGCAELRHPKERPRIVLWIAKKHQRKGYGLESVRALQRYAIEKLAPHKFLTAVVSKHNVPAKRMFEKLGAELQGAFTFKKNELGQDGILVTYRLYH